MLKHISVIIILGFLVMACNSYNQPKKPDNLISKTKMTELLYELYVINGAKGINRTILETNGFNPETYILTKYNIDSTQFADSNTYYAFNTEIYKTIVDEVKARLEKEKKAFEDVREIENESIKTRKDSVKKLKKARKSPKIKVPDSTVFKGL